jgi:hypothetical protein
LKTSSYVCSSTLFTCSASIPGKDTENPRVQISSPGRHYLKKDAAGMMKVYIGNIVNYFTDNITNPRAQGINSKIALMEKMAPWCRNGEHPKAAIYFKCGNLKLYP